MSWQPDQRRANRDAAPGQLAGTADLVAGQLRLHMPTRGDPDGGAALVTFEDSLSLQSADPAGPDERTDQVRGRLDAVLAAARVASLTRNIGLIPAVTVTHTEPFHISKAIATLDYVSTGRAGLRVQVSARRDEAAQSGRPASPTSGWGTPATRPRRGWPATCSTRPPITRR